MCPKRIDTRELTPELFIDGRKFELTFSTPERASVRTGYRSLAEVLQPICDRLDGIAKDSKRQLETSSVSEPCVFLTYDAEKRYPSIDLNDAIRSPSLNLGEMRRNK